jgi:L-asparaginase
VNSLPQIAVFSTGGTFNKVYNPLTGTLEIDPEAKALRRIMERWLCRFELHTLLHKDSLDLDDADRETLARAIRRCPAPKILVVHGTDTIDRTAAFLARTVGERPVLLTGAMVPYSIDPVEATANFASAVGWLLGCDTPGVRIAMHGRILPYDEIVKDREKGRFVPKE